MGSGRLSAMAGSASCPGIRRGAHRGGCGAGEPRAARSARQHAQGGSRQGSRRACHLDAHADALVAVRIAHQARSRGQEPCDPCRAGIPQGHDRGAGRRIAACRSAGGGKAGRAGHRPLRRRRRQDAGARGGDGKSRANLRNRSATSAGSRRSTHGSSAPACHNVQVSTPKTKENLLADSQSRADLVADRCALHRHRHMAAQSRRQVADAAGCACSAAEASRLRRSIAPPRW